MSQETKGYPEPGRQRIPGRILLVDDDAAVLSVLNDMLLSLGYQVVPVNSGVEALARIEPKIDLVILDIAMPTMDGFEVLRQINRLSLDIPVIFLTGVGCMDFAIRAVKMGAYDFLTKPVEGLDFFDITIQRALEKRALVLKEQAHREELEREVRLKTSELEEKNLLLMEYGRNLEHATIDSMLSLQAALEEKDVYTAGHTMRVTRYALAIAEELGMGADELTIIERACQVHDIGKLIIDIRCIAKPGPLSDEEWQLMRKHSLMGENIIKPLSFLQKETDIVRHHHERVDGKGYPDGIGGSELDVYTRIVTLADSYDAMTSQRSYRRMFCAKEALAEVQSCAGKQFCPEVVKAFVSIQKSKTPLESRTSTQPGRARLTAIMS